MPNDTTLPTRMHHLSGSEKFAIIPMEWMPHIKTFREMRTFLALLAHANAQGECWPSPKTLAGFACLPERHVRASLHRLEGLGAIETTRTPGKASRYRVMPAPPKQGVTVLVQGGADRFSADPLKQGVTVVVQPACTVLVQTPRTDIVQRSNHVTDHLNIPTSATTEKKNDGKEDDDQANDLAAEYALASKRVANMPEARMLAVCARWEAGDDVPMPLDLIELYRALRHVRGLPARPSTVARIASNDSSRRREDKGEGIPRAGALLHCGTPCSLQQYKSL